MKSKTANDLIQSIQKTRNIITFAEHKTVFRTILH